MNIQTFLFLMRSHVRVGLAVTEKPAGGNVGCGTRKIPRSGLRVKCPQKVRQYFEVKIVQAAERACCL